MTEPYLFEKAIGHQMGDLCRLAMGNAKVTQTGEIVTLEEMLGRGTFGVSVEVPYTSGGVQSVSVTRCGKNLMEQYAFSCSGLAPSDAPTTSNRYGTSISTTTPYDDCVVTQTQAPVTSNPAGYQNGYIAIGCYTNRLKKIFSRLLLSFTASDLTTLLARYPQSAYTNGGSANPIIKNSTSGRLYSALSYYDPGNARQYIEIRLSGCSFTLKDVCFNIDGSLDYEPYTGDTYTITMPAGFYGGSIDLEAGTVTSRYASDGSLLAEPVVTDIDPISIPILSGVNNIWADVGTVTVSYYAADAETFRPALWYPTIYRGLTSARYLIKRASGAIASFDDAVAAPLVGLRVALPWRSEGYDAVEVTRCGKNLLSLTDRTTRIINGTTCLFDNEIATLNGTGTLAANTQIICKIPSSWLSKPNHLFYWKQHVFSGSGETANGSFAWGIWNNQLNIYKRLENGQRSFASESQRMYFYPFESNIAGQYQIVIQAFGVGAVFDNLKLGYSLSPNGYLDTWEPAVEPAIYTITLPTTIYGGYLDVVTGQLVATHDANGNLLTNQKLYFLDPVNVSALAGVNNIWSDAGDVAVSYRIDNG